MILDWFQMSHIGSLAPPIFYTFRRACTHNTAYFWVCLNPPTHIISKVWPKIACLCSAYKVWPLTLRCLINVRRTFINFRVFSHQYFLIRDRAGVSGGSSGSMEPLDFLEVQWNQGIFESRCNWTTQSLSSLLLEPLDLNKLRRPWNMPTKYPLHKYEYFEMFEWKCQTLKALHWCNGRFIIKHQLCL